MKKMHLTLAIAGVLSGGLLAQQTVNNFLDGRDVSPAFGIQHPPEREFRPPEPAPLPGNRSFDGTGNNQTFLDMGSTFTHLQRWSVADYADGFSALAGSDRVSPRVISNLVAAQEDSLPNPLGATDFLWQWGQFIDHDIDLTDGVDPAEPANIAVPLDDAYFIPGSEIPLNRSIYDHETGISTPREQLNEITAWIDASNVYGSDLERANALRTLDGTGRLKTSAGELLPFNTEGLENAGGDSAELFVAGDVRANEQVGLTVMHTLFVREHNRLVGELAQQHPDWDGEHLYQAARRLVGGMLQHITYREFLPALLGDYGPRPYSGYRPQVDGGIANMFSGAAYRFGHSALSPTLLRVNAFGDSIPEGDLALRDAFFAAPRLLVNSEDLDPFLRGLATQTCQTVDVKIINDVRNFLFGNPQAGGFDLASLNIQRGRDHGLPSYNQARVAMGLAPAQTFAEVTSDEALAGNLALAYDSPDNMDMWVGGLAEDPLPGAHVGELIARVLRKQFEHLRDADRFWYERALAPDELDRVRSTRLADVIRLNTGIGNELQDDVFHVAASQVQPPQPPSRPRPPRR